MEREFESLPEQQKLKLTMFCETRKMCQEVGACLNLEFEKKAMDLISEIVWRKTEMYTEDLEAFSRHGKRTTVNIEDVKLAVRNNPSLKERITRLANEQIAASGKDHKRKKTKEAQVPVEPQVQVPVVPQPQAPMEPQPGPSYFG